MADLNLHKFDQKGNLIKEWVFLIKGVANEYPGDITTDRNNLWLTRYDVIAGTSSLYQYTKKGTLAKGYALADTNSRGITTDKANLILSSSASIYTLAKKNLAINSKASAAYYWLARDGNNILAAKATAQIDVLDANTGAIKKSITTTSTPSGLACTDTHIFTIEAASIYVRDMRGVLQTTYALPSPTSRGYVGITGDKSYLWLMSYPIVDVDPV